MHWVKPVIVFDVDGTLANYHDHLANFAWAYWGKNKHTRLVDRTWDGSGEFEDYLGLTKDRYREAKLAFRQGGMKRTMPAYGDLLQLARYVGRHTQVDLWIATTRPWQRLDNVDPDTRFWLEQMGVGYNHLLFGDDKYGDLCERVDPARVLLLVDDLPEQVARALELGYAGVQVARPHNEHADNRHIRRLTPKEIQYCIEEHIEATEKKGS